ncbi:MAG: DUF3604 domain-containing protein [Gammaproteobacteria bacterium]|nr:DUF3604 domain-containing protein [Gammaproteobacteria bacterium]
MKYRLLLVTLVFLFQSVQAFERTEQRQPCADYQVNRKPLFGDLHIHTRYYFDAYVSSLRQDPADAYRYAKGAALDIPAADGVASIKTQLNRPLDFAAVTDHGEFLGQIGVCTEDASEPGYWWPHCTMTRSTQQWVQLLAVDWWTGLSGQKQADKSESFACTLSDCKAAGNSVWKKIQDAAEHHYDRSAECSFTTFVGYEYTDSPERQNMHRNVIFRNEAVIDNPITTYETGRYNFPALWRGLRQQCIEAGTGCDVLAIPHNANLSGGLMFRDPESEEELNDRLFFEPVVELIQHKGASECRWDRSRQAGLSTEDELCSFEQVPGDNLGMLGTVNGVVHTDRAKLIDLSDFGRRNMVRNVYKDGLVLGRDTGTNPFVMGVIGSTDTHSATPGATREDNFTGHLGRRDSGFRNVQDHFYSNPGGHAVVWAEENSRDAIFSAIRRKETYATSGTRPILRFFAGTELDNNACSDPQAVTKAYHQGVPMGGSLDAVQSPLKFFVSAQKDPGIPGNPGTDLQRIQIIKGWVDTAGQSHERVIDVAGDADNGAGVDPNNCQRIGRGENQLCTVWQDPEFDPDVPAFYYARVVENPTCRWSTRQCQTAGVNPFAADCAVQAEQANQEAADKLGSSGDVYGKCCLDPEQQPFYSPVIQERAWSSPIWYLQAQGQLLIKD